MQSYKSEVDAYLLGESEEELEAAGELFEKFIELIKSEDFEDFDSFYRLANFLIEDYWPNCGMFAEVSSQLFTEYEIGTIDWIWQNTSFMAYCLKFMESDIHFGCFVLTEGLSNEKFTEVFAKKALLENCYICAEIGEGWLGPKAYVCEELTASQVLLEEFSDLAFKQYASAEDHDKYESIMMMRALAANGNTPREILEKLTHIKEQSIGHESRNVNAEMDSVNALKDSYVGWKASETLKNL